MTSTIARLVLLIGTLAACAPGRGADFCAKTDMNRLVWVPEFEAAVHDYFGGERGDFYWPDGVVAEQVIEGLGGPPNDIERLPGGLVMGSACRAHSCMERAAVIARCPSTVVAFGVKYFPCGAARCDSLPSFTIFSAPGAPQVARQRLEEWVRSEAGPAVLAPRIQYRAPRSGPHP